MNTHKIQLMSGETILITENQANAIKEAIKNGAEWIPVGEEMINPKAIAKIGFHHASAQERKMQENEIEMNLLKEGRNDLVDMKRKLVMDKTIERKLESGKKFMEKVQAGDPQALKSYYNMPDEPKQLVTGTDNSGDFYELNGEKYYS